MKSCHDAAIPLRATVTVEDAEKEVKVTPEEEATKEGSEWELPHQGGVLLHQVIISAVQMLQGNMVRGKEVQRKGRIEQVQQT